MIHHLTLFLASEGCIPQATSVSPPAQQAPARHRRGAGQSIRFMAGVAANAAGFGLLLAGCGFFLQLMYAFLQL